MRAALLAGLLWLAAVPGAPAVAQGAAEGARAAAADLAAAGERLAAAQGSRDRVRALTDTVRAYEAGLAAMREGLRAAALRERRLAAALDAEEAGIARLVGALHAMRQAPEATLLLHPAGPVATARAAMIVADLAPAMQARAAGLRARLGELGELRAVQENARDVLQAGLDGAEAARLALATALSERAAPPDATATDLAAMQALVESADTLQGFAGILAGQPGDDPAFASRKGALALPVAGRLLSGFGEPDAAGVRRPGLLVAGTPLALVTSPADATVRYAGPLLDLGQVAILEPAPGWLLVLSGLAESWVRQGDVVASGDAIGRLGGAAPGARDILIAARDGGGGQSFTETLYIELRRGETPVDPAPWFGPAPGPGVPPSPSRTP